MKSYQSAVVRPIVTLLALFIAVFGAPIRLGADETREPAFPTLTWGAGREEIQMNLGVPAFTADSILMYRAEVLTPEGAVAADLTLWFRADKLFFASYAFQVADRSKGDVSAEFESVSEQMQAIYGEPSSRASTPGSFTTEVWNLDDVDIEHTLVLDPGRLDHVVSFTAARG
ncbi:MAG: hypothetical protein V3S41_04330 [Spirochaetia bacterium]